MRFLGGIALILALIAQTIAPAFADTTSGGISGTITSAKTNAPIPNASLSIVSASTTLSAKTDAKGFFSLIGVPPDTYTVTVKAAGYDTAVVSGVTVNPQQTYTFSQVLGSTLTTIGRISARSQNGAFQPAQPQDTYSVSPAQIDTILGKSKATSEADLLTALPGASLDSSGYPVLRGGRENEEGFQFEGIDYTDAFTSQFVNSLQLNGTGNFQLTPGTGDASTGNAGTGSININLLRGKRPAFGTFGLEVQGKAFSHQLTADYGIATPDGRLSNYISFVGQRNGFRYGNSGADLVAIGRPISQQYALQNDLVDNLIFKFGKDNSQQLQFVYQNQQNNFFLQGAPGTIERYASGDKLVLNNWSAFTGLSAATIGSLLAFDPYQTGQNDLLATSQRSAQTYYQPNETFKLQYSNNINASTFLTAKFYRVGAVTTFDFPYANNSFYFEDAVVLQGGERTGATLDITKQLGSKHLVALGIKNEFVHPVDAYTSATGGLGNLVFGNAGSEIYDFVNPNSPDCANIGVNCGYLLGNNTNGPNGTGVNYFPNGAPRIPVYNQSPQINRQDLSFYLTDTFQASDRLKLQYGVRVDSANFNLPSTTAGGYLPAGGSGYTNAFYLPSSTGTYKTGTTINGVDVSGMPDPSQDRYNTGGSAVKNPFIVEPRFSFSYQLSKNDAIRASYGRAVSLPSLTYIAVQTPRAPYAAFAGIPATANVCGPTADRVCRDYADQLYFENQLTGNGIPIQPVKPATFNNYDLSVSHDFGHGLTAKITPFYRRGYDAFALVQSQKFVAGQPVLQPDGSPQLNAAVATNLGINRTTGVEFFATKEAAYGLSGQISATYINEFSNVVPTSGSEDFFPGIPPPSLGLGNQYRVGFISPFNVTTAAAYKFRNGFKINPIVYFNRGYPYGNGGITATTVNGKYVNVPQTNVTNQLGGTTLATNYVDPQNPGTLLKPNVAAKRGTPEGPSAGTYLTAPRAFANLDFEFAPAKGHSTIGVLVQNLFNQIYGQPALNQRYQPLATGIAGAKTGTTANTVTYGPAYGYANYSLQRFGNQAYTINPNNQPITFRLYYQYNI